MKKYLFLCFIIICLGWKAGAQGSLPVNSPVVVQLQSFNLGQFVGHPVDSLLTLLPAGQTQTDIVGSIVEKKAAYLIVRYAPRTSILIAVDTFTHMNPEYSTTGNPMQNWNLNQFKLEKISFAVVFNGGCINGCENELKIN